MRFLRIAAPALAAALAISAQTLQQAEAYTKARRYQEAYDTFKALAARAPNDTNIKVRWGRMLMEHAQNPDLDEAAKLFQQVLETKANDAGALLGMALLAEENYEGRAEVLARKALESDPKLLEAQELIARIALEDNNDAKATEEAKKALAIDANSVQGKAILATIDLLADKKDTPWDPHAARGYETIGHFFVQNRRYVEGIQYLRKAVEMDPQLYTARSELGINLMRQGQDDEAFKQLETCFNNGFQDNATTNSLKLIDSYKNYVEFKTDRTILKVDKKEADLLRLYVEPEMQKIVDTYEKKYRMKLDRPVQVEVYPNHDDFAVRTLGMPGMGGILGVTFGYVVALDSPSGRPPGQYHWATTLWHEMSHVFTLTATGSRVPRWFTEGMAVHEETAANPEWGDRITPEILMAIHGKKLLPVADLDRGFIHPTDPTQVIVSYYQGGQIIDYINEKWGWDTLLAMLHDFGANQDTPDVVRKELKIEPADFDKQFIAWVEVHTKKEVDNFDQWKNGIKKVSELAKAKDYDGVIKEGAVIRDLYPEYVEAGSAYEFLANAYLEKNDKPAAIAELDKYVHIGGRYPDTLKKLAKLLTESGQKKEAAEVLDRLNYIYPLDNQAHESLGSLWLEQGNLTGAIREFRAVLAHNPIDPAQAHYDLARALSSDHQPDQAKTEVFAALEAAPSFRPAQKLLLELSTPQNAEQKK